MNIQNQNDTDFDDAPDNDIEHTIAVTRLSSKTYMVTAGDKLIAITSFAIPEPTDNLIRRIMLSGYTRFNGRVFTLNDVKVQSHKEPQSNS